MDKRFCKYCKQTKNKEHFEGNRQRCNDCSYCVYCRTFIARAGSICSICLKKCRICKKNKKKEEYNNPSDRNCRECKNVSKKITKDEKQCITCLRIKNKVDFEKDCQRCKECYYCSYCKLPIKRGNICMNCTKECLRCEKYKRNHEYTLNSRICIECRNTSSCSKEKQRTCSSCKKLKNTDDFEQKRHRCNECCYCENCKSFIEKGNVCVKCNKKCSICKKDKLKEEYKSSLKICESCIGSKTCKVCSIILTSENTDKGRNRCKPCGNKVRRDYCNKKEEQIPEKICEECGFLLETKKYFIDANHKKCKQCIYKNSKKTLPSEDELRRCNNCFETKLNKEFGVRDNRYRNQCKACLAAKCSYQKYIAFKRIKVTLHEYTKEEFDNFVNFLTTKECFYCGKESKIDDKNGIDRLDSDYNYSEDNCVSCCNICNMMKRDIDVGSFIRKCCEIYDYKNQLKEDRKRLDYHKNIILENKTEPAIKSYKKKAHERALDFDLTEEQFEKLVTDVCYYCGGTSKGIDRVYNDIGYIEDNCVACCKYCNHMKRDSHYNIFLEHIASIELHTRRNMKVHKIAMRSKYHDLFAKSKLEIREKNHSIEKVNITPYMLGFLDSVCSIGSSGTYLVISIKSQRNIEYLRELNTQLGNIFMEINGHLSLKQNNLCELFINACKNSLTKHNQIEIAYKILHEKDKKQRKLLCDSLKESNTIKFTNKIYELSVEYIAGIFDAHGSIQFCGKNVVINITHSNKDILISLLYTYKDSYLQESSEKHKYGGLRIYSKNAQLNFIESIYPYISSKKKDLKKVLTYIEENRDISILKLQQNITVVKFEEIIQNIRKYTPAKLLHYNKYKEIKTTPDNISFDKMIYINFDRICELKPKLIFCETGLHHELWTYYRNKTSSICYSGSVGRCIRILVIDETTSKYIGIMSISSDLYNSSQRDTYIKESYPDLVTNDYINYVVNLSTCVPLQPFGSNCNGGKLLAKLAFTREVFDYWLNKYNQPFFIVNTLSINGKSIQYDRLKELKEAKQYTNGYSAYHIPQEIIDISCCLCKKLNIETRRPGKMERLNTLLSYLKIDKNILKHNIQKGVYFGWLFSTRLDQNYNLDELKSVEEKTKEWYTRWCVNRMDKMKKDGRFSENLSLYSEDSPQFDEVKHMKIL